MALHLCEDCGANLALVGLRHHCVPNKLVPNTVPNKAVPNTVPNAPADLMVSPESLDDYLKSNPLKSGDAQRVAKWKAANKDKHLAYHRELMRKRRGRA